MDIHQIPLSENLERLFDRFGMLCEFYANTNIDLYAGGSKTQVTFHRSLAAGHCFTFWKVAKTLNLANPRPNVGF